MCKNRRTVASDWSAWLGHSIYLRQKTMTSQLAESPIFNCLCKQPKDGVHCLLITITQSCPILVFSLTSRLLKKEENFIFIPRSREELPDNFPKEIPGICYFLEVRTGQKQPKSSVTSARVRKISYNIGTMFLRETSLWSLLQIKDSSKKHKPRTGSWQERGDSFFFTALFQEKAVKAVWNVRQ